MLAKSPPGKIAESKPQQQTIKTQQYLPLKSTFLRKDWSFHFHADVLSAHAKSIHTHKHISIGKEQLNVHAGIKIHILKHAPK